MAEQNKNLDFDHFFFKALKKFCVLFIALISLALSGCLPTGEESINTELFKSKDDLKQKASQLRPGIKKGDVFRILDVAPEKFQRMNLSEVQSSIYGNSQVQGSPTQLEEFRRRMMSYEGYALPYRILKDDGSLGFGTMKFHKTGQDLRLVLIFENNRLLRSAIEGTEDVSLQENQYLWGALIRKGIGLAF
jgi:hypothetical protein